MAGKEIPEAISMEDIQGAIKDDFAIEIENQKHKIQQEGEAIVFMESGTSYKIKLINGNNFSAMVSIEMDGVVIGMFLLNANSQTILERPQDRPIGFLFGSQEVEKAAKKQGKKNKYKVTEGSKSCIVCTFMPELGAKVIQMDITAPITQKVVRVEMPIDCKVNELFGGMEQDFGDWVFAPHCALLHWTTAEYDSPVDDVLTCHMEMLLRNYKRKEEPVRCLSFITFEKVQITIEEEENSFFISLDGIPTFGQIIDEIKAKLGSVNSKDTGENKILYFKSDTNRLIGTSSWIQDVTYVYQLLHKDELLRYPDYVSLRVTVTSPKENHVLYAKPLNGQAYKLQTSPWSTIRECRYQLKVLGGHWGDESRWLFGGTLMENGNTLDYYGIPNHAFVDIIQRSKDQSPYKNLEMVDPIAVENEKTVNSAELLRKEICNKKKKQKGKRPLQRGGTTLKGRIVQQFIEVDPIQVDQRFYTNIIVSMLPIDAESSEDIELGFPDENTQEKSTTLCCLM